MVFAYKNIFEGEFFFLFFLVAYPASAIKFFAKVRSWAIPAIIGQ